MVKYSERLLGRGKVSGSSGRYGVVVVVWYIVGVLSGRQGRKISTNIVLGR